ncbi:HtaA domain-containing protein [Streptomyces avermitilis]|uniref:HtaA domain-containing protein n=1 Tax=Streptomyces avermitilis TaxID=33903 RepID=UPI0033F1F124
MTKRPGVVRPGAAALAGGALFALLCPGAVAAESGDAFSREVSGGYASWATASAALADHGVSMGAGKPAVRGSADRTWFPATGGGTDPETGDVDVGFAGTARLTRSADPAQPLVLDDLRLRLTDGAGALYARTELGGRERTLALAGVRANDAEPVVRTGGSTWTGLRASLTDEGARLLSAWSGQRFAEGDALGELAMTVGTGGVAAGKPAGPGEVTRPSPAPSAATPEKQEPTAPAPAPASAAVARPDLTAGGEQRVTGEGFAPGEVVLVAIDDDTRYQAVADGEGRVSRSFPVYATAAEGEHAVELYTAAGDRRAAVRFGVRARG